MWPKKIKCKFEIIYMIKGINKSKTLMKHVSSESKCEFDGRNCI